MAIKWSIFYDGNTSINARIGEYFVYSSNRIVFKSIYISCLYTTERSLMMSVLVPCCVVVVIGKNNICYERKTWNLILSLNLSFDVVEWWGRSKGATTK